jgi:branched-chain amino acid transport system permease protein
MLLGLNLANAAQVTLGGLATGALYAVILLGVLLVFQVSKNINFAYGQTGMLAAFGSWYLYAALGLPVWLALLLGFAAAVTVAALTDLVIIRRIPDRQGFDLVVTLGELLLLTAAAQFAFGTSAQSYLALLTHSSAVLAGVYVNGNDLLAIALGVAITLAGHFALSRTGLGVALRAAAEDPAVAKTVGINVLGLRTATWAVSGILAAIGAMMFASRLSVNAFYMTPVLINVFIAGMIGGLDRYWPPMIAAFLIAVYQSWAIYLLGEAGSVPALFVLVVLVLALAPRRFVEERHEARA